ncbi:MAG: hypothetical protein ISS80_02725 [Candidatus Cloacimonetes bacterium]|nr:hypothetical protein [Candidatus Cloacimonadota bacterium]
MKELFKYILILLVIILLISCSNVRIQKRDTITASYSNLRLIGPKKRIYISEFENRSAYGQRRLGKGISDILSTELSKTNSFILLEREKLETIMKEQTLGQTGLINEQIAPEVGKLLGANAIITGSITQFGVRTETYDIILTSGKKQIATCTVDIRIIDINTGQIAWAGSGQGEAIRSYTSLLGSGTAGGYDEALEGKAFRAAIIKVMENLIAALNNLEWSCTIAKVTESKIYINAGKKSNLKLNINLTIYSLGEEILDPNTGVEIGKEEIKIGKGQLISFFGEDGAVLKLIEGSIPKRGNICKLQ